MTASDSICLAILLENNRGIPPEKAGDNCATVIFHSATHYILVNRHYGFKDARENGYTGIFLAKSRVQREEAARFFAEVINLTAVPVPA